MYLVFALQHVVYAVEKFLKHTKPPLRLGIVYLIDALCKTDRAKGKDDPSLVYAARFAKRMTEDTLPQLRAVPSEDRCVLLHD